MCVVCAAPQSRRSTPALVIFTQALEGSSAPWRFLGESVSTGARGLLPISGGCCGHRQSRERAGEGRARPGPPHGAHGSQRWLKTQPGHVPGSQGDTANLLSFLPCLSIFRGPFKLYSLQMRDSKMGMV